MRTNSNNSNDNLRVDYTKNQNNYPTLDEIQFQKKQIKKAKKQQLDHLYNQNYQPARYAKALQYKNSRSYLKKMPNGKYRQLDTLEGTDQLKAFGLGPYFYVQFMRRITWLFFVLSLLEGIRIYINVISTGLSNFTPTFSTYLINTTLGNYNGNVLTQYDNYIMAIIPGVVYAAILLFFFIWKCHYHMVIEADQEDNSVVKPEKFCLQVQGFYQDNVDQRQLQRIYSSFGPVYQISLVRRFKDKLSYFAQLDQIQEQIKQQELQIILGSGDQQNLATLKRQKQKLSRFINTLRITPQIISAFIHFQYQKSKVDCLAYFNDRYLFQSNLHSCMHSVCCCCIDDVSDKYLYRGKPLRIKSAKVSNPEQINWDSYQINGLSKFFRVLTALIIILVFIFISCSIIALCSIYINSHASDCQKVDMTKSCASGGVTCSDIQKICYCNKNLFAALRDNTINSYCGAQLNQIYIAQGIQYAVVAISAITNSLFGIVIEKIINFTRPSTFSSGLMAKTVVLTFFLIFNTVLIPILIYSDIYGFKTTQYASLLTIISSDVKNIFKVDQLQFYLDFQRIWYSNVSPVFTNYLVFDVIFIWIFFFYNKCTGDKSGLKDDQGRVLQKTMNESITSYNYKLYVQYAYFNLVIFMGVFLSAGMPIMLPLAFLNVFSRYVTSRNILQTISTKVQGLSQAFMSYPLTFLPSLIVVGSLFGGWMLTANNNLTPPNLNLNIDIKLPDSANVYQLVRQLYLPYFLIIAIITLIWFLFEQTLIRFFSWLSSLCFEKKVVAHPYHAKPFSDYSKTMNVLSSYNIRNNDKFRNVILNLEKYLVVNDEKF